MLTGVISAVATWELLTLLPALSYVFQIILWSKQVNMIQSEGKEEIVEIHEWSS